MSNILIAFSNLIKNTKIDLPEYTSSNNRANQMGESLEIYVKDLLCNSYHLPNSEKLVQYNKHFSYLGNQNNPPDMMLRNGDALEVKKITSNTSSLALNSSHPKDKLYANDPKISGACRNAENWIQKDIIYTIGQVKNNQIKYIWFVYGDCYAANKETYTRVGKAISKGINMIQDIKFEQTNELARINKVDPLGVTYLRVRGMWGIENPKKVYEYLPQSKNKFANLLVLRNKYESFPEKDRNSLENITNKNFIISDVKIKNPNNPAKLLDAKLLSLEL